MFANQEEDKSAVTPHQSTNQNWEHVREVFQKNMENFYGICHERGEGGTCAVNLFFKNHLESFPDCQNVFCT